MTLGIRVLSCHSKTKTADMQRLLAALVLCMMVPASAQPRCASDSVDVPKDRASATANSGANLRKAPGSLRVELSRLVGDAQKEVKQVKPPSGNACSSRCRVVKEPAHILVSVVPNKFLKSYGEAQKCEGRLKQTSTRPLRFGPRHAKSEDELATWLSDVSQGHGEDGTVLYKECDGKCSPRYFMDIAQDGNGFVGNLSVVCGPARDKEDNTYTISTGYRLACESSR